MNTQLLLDHLLDRIHTLQNSVVIDCLLLARLDPSPNQTITWQELAKLWGVGSRMVVCKKVRYLREAGLIDCHKGAPYHPGYQFSRIGPLEDRKPCN
jgi:hypothetical protein